MVFATRTIQSTRSRMAQGSPAWVSSRQSAVLPLDNQAQSIRLGLVSFQTSVLSILVVNMKSVLVSHRSVRSGLVPSALLATLACTAYTPLQLGQAAAGYNVRVTLSDQGAVDLTPKIGARAVQLEGTLREASDSSVLLTVR